MALTVVLRHDKAMGQGIDGVPGDVEKLLIALGIKLRLVGKEIQVC